MNRRRFLKVLGLAPLVVVVGPVVGRGALLGDDRLPNTEEQVKKRLAEIERRVGVGEDGNSAICLENGQPYKTIMWDPTGKPFKDEGYPGVVFPTRESAWALWFMALTEYRKTHKGKIHWRVRPELHECYSGADTLETIDDLRLFDGYIVYARLVADDL